uniref:Uncharacterized protein n=1 Tax=Ditylenchus dipsaci TaxID=166011 RepID=A0A915CZR4_9BILA
MGTRTDDMLDYREDDDESDLEDELFATGRPCSSVTILPMPHSPTTTSMTTVPVAVIWKKARSVKSL